MTHFVPLSTYELASLRAVVVMAATSEPAFGSLIAKAAHFGTPCRKGSK
jgi:hypothetical protein